MHTRGLCKFGRPDISIENVDEGELNLAYGIVNQMIYYLILGDVFEPGKRVKLHTSPKDAFIIQPEFVNDPDNDDFNNVYYRIHWGDCEQLVNS